MGKKITITKKTDTELEDLGVRNWPTWACEASDFPWEYSDQETCFLLDGDVEVTTDEETVRLGAGDFVVFPKGLKCRWKVMKPVRKHYNFG
ncbi:MAG TPA: DUF861 domain-containing protein [Candidatus Marinimicrobia bacterium]|nr:DUF861 domain-containing protein [Candidatus Neomarinimicrobiota bacterium]